MKEDDPWKELALRIFNGVADVAAPSLMKELGFYLRPGRDIEGVTQAADNFPGKFGEILDQVINKLQGIVYHRDYFNPDISLDDYFSLTRNDQFTLVKKLYQIHRVKIKQLFSQKNCSWILMRFDGSVSGFGKGNMPNQDSLVEFAKIDNKPFAIIVPDIVIEDYEITELATDLTGVAGYSSGDY